MKYTFLLPAFKGRFLDEMLQSIQRQTYTDFKVIISDDCSPEDLRSICEPYLKDPRFTYRRNAENMGSKSLVSHWNLLVDMCDTEFLIMASDDDIYSINFLFEIDKLTRKYPDTDLFRGRVAQINEDRKILQNEYSYDEYWSQHHFYRVYFNPMFVFSEANYVYRTKVFKNKGRYVDFPLAWFTDSATHLQMATRGIANTPSITFLSRTSSFNISVNDSKEVSTKKLEATFLFLEWIKQFHKKLGEYPEEIYLMRYALYDCQQEIKSNINKYLPMCGIANFLRYMAIAQKELNMSRIMMILNWCNYHKMWHYKM